MVYEFFPRGGHCVAVFNSLAWNGSYEWRRALRTLGFSALHIRDEEVSWFHNCLEEALELIKEHQPQVLVGSSMGGYGALLFSALTGIKARAFGPQTTLLASWDRRWKEQWWRIRNTTDNPDLLDLAGIDLNADIYYCRGNTEDKRHAERIKARLFPRGCDTHDGAIKEMNWRKVLES